MRVLFLLCPLLLGFGSFAQPIDSYLSLVLGDAMREAQVPGAACAVITSDSITYGVMGVVTVGSEISIEPQSYFHIGSCTKSVTGYIAALAVKDSSIRWDTKFFDLFPALRTSARDEYSDITLADLLSHQAWLQAFTSEKAFKKLPEYADDDLDARLKFAKVALSLKPVKLKESYEYSNAGYVLAALMIEKATGKTWEDHVSAYFQEQGWNYRLGYLSYTDESQPSGHYRKKEKVRRIAKEQNFDVPPFFAPAGDISMRVVDYAAYLQQHLVGLQQGDQYFTKEEYRNLHYRNEAYALGWGHGTTQKGTVELSTHTGSAGAFLAMMIVVPDKDLAILVVTNTGDDKVSEAAVKSVRNRLLRERF
ncbi:MAG: serine hydrolase domain-containing protein [Saprospiraceae bacterium]